ncbi:M17 family metallopeptidase [Knoellia sp. p5-6-4]|uniref:leucyl aminopeptidase family protein n=1 Tax=unclassified Knoellia TaxID=2618719 RepID=UPI0023DC340F|nr:leucyl aminopeptidase family protein [Knoellia sp. p5-6-4]MDF2144284.1 leucyl aminopeptidase family protein [Knoellia sp. p5-6-4]
MPDDNTPDLLNPASSRWESTDRALADVLAGSEPAGLVLALPVAEGGLATEGPDAEAVALLGLDATWLAEAYEPEAKPGAVTTVPLPSGRPARVLVLVGTGSGSAADLRTAGAALGREARGRGHLVTPIPAGGDASALAAFVEGCCLGGYTPPRWSGKPADPKAAAVSAVTLTGAPDAEVVRRAVVRARATMLARNLAVTPSNIKNPAWMAAQAETIAKRTGLGVRVWSDADLRREGFGGLLAVGGGSATPPRLVQLDHTPRGASRKTPRVVLVGKGITFDTGGLDIKPAEGMLAMKTDMSGSAIVLAVLAACRDLDVPVRVTGLLALAENAVGAASYRPGDVVKQYGGRTVEIGNTDAEGRIVMADALAYADRHLDPDVLLDIATLTGAARVAFGRSMAPVYATDDALREQLVAAGQRTGETLWPLPLVEDYRPDLDSEVADINHIAGPKSGAGSITAALFLREFAGDRRWAHLDIAGTGRSDVDRGLLSKGATGFGARLLLTLLEDMQ